MARAKGIPMVTTLVWPSEKIAPHVQPMETPSEWGGAAGPDKAEAVRAVLLGRLIGTLVADEGLARALLQVVFDI
jgi:DNA-binding transcriptional regulator LsrR (DeoR family)